ncbi:ABM domain-containing protein [Haematococcus lacustris]|uniref:ABM domain-containing protein n=1 Tax=Haematococcus lacustris TaxID=44745 RepID=A0A699YVL2_HAELA|nr:ABM domain-containing protein [Haematococcus lacustris]
MSPTPMARWAADLSRLQEMSGFIRFAMLKCVNVPGKYISMTTWADEPSFRAWTTSSQFKASHGGGKSEGQPEQASKRPGMMGMLDGPPSPEMFETVTITE